MKIIRYQILLLTLAHSFNAQPQPVAEPEDIFITVVTAGQQTSSLQNQEKQCLPCQKLFGTRLNECMHYQTDGDFKTQFFSMHPRARFLYLMSLSTHEHHSLLTRFKDEHEWQACRNDLAPAERQYLPATLQEQYDIIEKAPKLDNYYRARFDCFMRYYEHDSANCLVRAINQHYREIKENLLKKYRQADKENN